MTARLVLLGSVVFCFCFVGCESVEWQEYRIDYKNGVSAVLSAPSDLILQYEGEGLTGGFYFSNHIGLFSLSLSQKYGQVVDRTREDANKIEKLVTPSGEWEIIVGGIGGGEDTLVMALTNLQSKTVFFFGSPQLSYTKAIRIIKSIEWTKIPTLSREHPQSR